MTTQNPYEANEAAEPADDPQAPLTSGRAAYNVVTDTVVGLNTRGSDNRFQAKCILIAVPICSAIMALLAALNPAWGLPWAGGAGIGAVAGLILGTFGSGVFLMVYRGIRHFQGKHD